MNVVQFIAEQHQDGGWFYSTVEIMVDGRRLADVIEAVERPMATREGSAGIAGDYAALSIPGCARWTYYLGITGTDDGDNDDKTALLDCHCGSPGCWPLVCRIVVGDATVAWRDFEQPHRDEDSRNFWDYSEFPGFEFSKRQYLAALKEVT